MRNRINYIPPTAVSGAGPGTPVYGEVRWGPDFGNTAATARASVALTNLTLGYSVGTARTAVAMPTLSINGLSSGTARTAIARGATTHNYLVGSNAVTEEDTVGAGWSNDANAAGVTNGTNATFAGSLTSAQAGTLVLNYRDFPDEGLAAYTITNVRLRFYSTQSGTVLGNGTLNHRYRLGAGAWVILETFTADKAVALSEYNLTGTITTWAQLDSLAAGANFSTALANVSTGTLDAIELIITATY